MSPRTDLVELVILVLAAWLMGCALLLGLKMFSGTRARISGLWPLLLTEAGILLAGTLPWFLPQPVLGIVLAAAAARIGYESGFVNAAPDHANGGRTGSLLLAGFALLAWFANPAAGSLSILPWAAAISAVIIVAAWNARLRWLWRFLLFPVLPFVLFTHFARWHDMAVVFVFALLIVEIFDSFSLLGGRLIGRRLMAPKLSPRKTWEGLGIGLAAAFLVSAGLSLVLDMDRFSVAVLAAAATAGALVGDLAASAAKRRAGVKDYPAVITIQGGLLDIYDAWMVAAPAAIATLLLLRWLG